MARDEPKLPPTETSRDLWRIMNVRAGCAARKCLMRFDVWNILPIRMKAGRQRDFVVPSENSEN